MLRAVAVVADNCCTNRAILRQIGPTFVGCHNYWLTLYLQDAIEQRGRNLFKIQALIRRLSYIIPAAKPRRLTPLPAVQRNESGEVQLTAC